MKSIKELMPQAMKDALRAALADRYFSVSFGLGVDSTALLVALYVADLRPDLISFGDTGGEKKVTLDHLKKMDVVLREWGWPTVTVCKKIPLASTGYKDLYGNCVANETLPSLAFGMKSCSIKWKQVPQDFMIMGAKSGPNKSDPHPIWLESQAAGERIVKLIGYDAGKADMRRAKAIIPKDSPFDYLYPLQILGWARAECIAAITAVLGEELVPIKSACFYCPASKIWELYWLAAHDPEQLEAALKMERVALTGKHSRFDSIEFGATWEEFVQSGTRFPSTATTVGLGRSFSWNQWAIENNVTNSEFFVHRSEADKERFLRTSDLLRGADNALDKRRHIEIVAVE